MGKWYDSHMI